MKIYTKKGDKGKTQLLGGTMVDKNHIKTHSSTTLTIDLFFVGIVFVKSELSKENFTIRF